MKMSFRAKRLARQNQRLAQASKLNLVALMDIFTILVFFLMVNQSEVKVLQSNKDISLPRSVSEQLPTEQVMLTITANGILVQGKPLWQGDWQQDVSVWQPELATALTAELNYLSARAAPLTEAQQPTGRALTLLGDAATPYLVLRQLMAICATTEYRDLSLAVELTAAATAPSEAP
ncbi:MAG: biopolymer transporter ExbD [Gammaproteobacteria bacterium]|nr:biopolymer transporter ExbD [Gammaproteobacteria bacterium]MBU1554403.1 biopolymer transporter ExbD [Gammaproteobacteria bacterium]MBU2071904.1 biopolymer transporter ExbD [Gammaproteobacteria bacterium]MBU2181765.1 biopolymer transporter ExbD [Gammaproteobacteria bacterium]MBU2206353.1 biopolymer transporter ExbD [Gammaproteobacteria bacterium]